MLATAAQTCPCVDCGGPKPSGKGVRRCDRCREEYAAGETARNTARAATRRARKPGHGRSPCTVCGGAKPPGCGRSRCENCIDAPYPSKARVAEKACARCRRVRPVGDFEPLPSARPKAPKERRLCVDCVGTRTRSAPPLRPCQCGNPKRAGRGQIYCDECYITENAKARKILLARKLADYRATQTVQGARTRRSRAQAFLRAAGFADARVELVVREVVWTRDEGVCGICGDPADPDDWHMDHVIPLARGGSHTYANVQVSHPSCNLRKSDSL